MIAVELENMTRADQHDPKVLVGLNRVSDSQPTQLHKGMNTVTFTALVHEPGEQRLIIRVVETDEAWRTGLFRIADVRIHGVSVGGALLRCTYVPRYDDEFLAKHPDMPRQMPMVFDIGNRGEWSWSFDAPVHDNKPLNVGLW
jgi:hypothetical protein